MRKAKPPRVFGNCGGAVLLLAMIFLLLLATVSATVLNTALLQARMAGNDQFHEEAFQQARAIATELSLEPGNFHMTGTVGYTNCGPGAPVSLCNEHTLQTPQSIELPQGVVLDYRVVRRGPLFAQDFPIRESERTASSAVNSGAAFFEVEVSIDGTGNKLGSARVVRGLAVRVPAPQ